MAVIRRYASSKQYWTAGSQLKTARWKSEGDRLSRASGSAKSPRLTVAG